jgi:hypothetical protein
MVDYLQTAVHELIKRFVERQSIVLEALRDLRPDMIMRIERRGSPKDCTEMRQKYSKASNIGYWGKNNEWAYRLHGIGCHLTHTKTGEIIGWDVGSLKRFDWYWFIDHLEWLLNTDIERSDVRIVRAELSASEIDRDTLRKLILPILEQLQEAEVIKPSQAVHRYILVKND